MVRSPTLFHAEVALAVATLYLDELQEQLFAARDKNVSLSTISDPEAKKLAGSSEFSEPSSEVFIQQ
ncbi:hypothetical protein K503DRAFT_870996 [Rhizopogon vinicolor AM-OR11-026]|uniref:Uncharacterized protein n=1 Tax=Rhizopogon vinicolor AM-OR11-026 TaxID=1314800 RepID=A0A1B7MD07_9AGAM|nr:hypothetical protein K503DRAFT_870996 [Rhizopogon vinicolor AM-OR11-026]